jgi:hypothetical protein
MGMYVASEVKREVGQGEIYATQPPESEPQSSGDLGRITEASSLLSSLAPPYLPSFPTHKTARGYLQTHYRLTTRLTEQRKTNSALPPL